MGEWSVDRPEVAATSVTVQHCIGIHEPSLVDLVRDREGIDRAHRRLIRVAQSFGGYLQRFRVVIPGIGFPRFIAFPPPLSLQDAITSRDQPYRKHRNKFSAGQRQSHPPIGSFSFPKR